MIDTPFLMGIIGAAVAMIIGVVVYSEISDVANEGYSVTTVETTDNTISNINGSVTNRSSFAVAIKNFGQEIAVTEDEQIKGTLTVTMYRQNGEGGEGSFMAHVWAERETPFSSQTTGGQLEVLETAPERYYWADITPFNTDLDFTFTFSGVPLQNENIRVGVSTEFPNDTDEAISFGDEIEGSPFHFRDGVGWVSRTYDLKIEIPIISEISSTTPPAPEALVRADSTAFTILTIIPISLFFGLFAIFGGFKKDD